VSVSVTHLGLELLEEQGLARVEIWDGRVCGWGRGQAGGLEGWGAGGLEAEAGFTGLWTW
jgi:hypothetical protein